LSVKIIKNGRKVVCGTGEGVLAVWSWGTWGDISDRFPGHPSSLDALLKVDENTLLTGSSDGLIRVVSIHPDKLLGVLGDHAGFPIEKLEFNADRSFVGSVSHDNCIRLWDATILKDDGDDEEGNKRSIKMQSSVVSEAAALKTGRESDDDMDEDTEVEEDKDEDSDENSSDEGNTGGKKGSGIGRLKSDNEKFFEDL
jgi:WD repeat-containing protein 55